MKSIHSGDLAALARQTTDHCVSLFMPIHPVGEGGSQDPIRLKNLVRRAEEELASRGMRPAEARTLLAPAADLVAHPTFWTEGGEGLAILVAPGVVSSFRLPRRVAEQVVISRRFHIKPLVPSLDSNARFYLLAVSQNKVRLYSGGEQGLTPLEVPGLPSNLEQALNLDVSYAGGQAHSAASQPQGKQAQGRRTLGKQAAVFTGQGGESDRRKDDLTQFLRLIDRALHGVLEAPRPLLVAFVGYLFPLFQEVCRYPHLINKPLSGNTDYLSDFELHQQAWPHVRSLLESGRSAALERLRESTGGTRLDDLRQILPAALQGKVGTLFLDPRRDCWGRFDESKGGTVLHDEPLVGDEELLNLSVIYTMKGNGEIVTVADGDLPSGGTVAALTRY
jgi:hypothetical protein